MYHQLIADPQGSFVAPRVWGIVSRKISQCSKVATFLDFIWFPPDFEKLRQRI